MSAGPSPDKIAEAIKATEPTKVDVEMMAIPVTIASTGRPAQLVIPTDATDAELMELTAWILGPVAIQLRKNRETPASRLVIARGGLPS